jgi:hypothetical protein
MDLWTLIEIHSGETVKDIGSIDPVLFDTEQEAMQYALDRFGPEAGKEYRIVNPDDL